VDPADWKGPELAEVHTWGYVVEETDDTLTIARDLCMHGNEWVFGGLMYIYKPSIVKRLRAYGRKLS
jgi:hypothetical protein